MGGNKTKVPVINKVPEIPVHKDNKKDASSAADMETTATSDVSFSTDGSFHSLVDLDKHSLHSLSLSQQRKESPNVDWSSCTHRSFFADSPYLECFIEQEMQNVDVAAKTLEDVGHEFTLFSNAAESFTKATRRLSSVCKLQLTTTNRDDKSSEEDVEQKRDALGPDVTATLERMGMLLEKIADAQEEFNKAFDPSTVTPLNLDISSEIEMATMLKNEAECHTKGAEDLFAEYLNGKEKKGSRCNSRNSSFKNSRNTSFKNSFSWHEKSPSEHGKSPAGNAKRRGSLCRRGSLETTTTPSMMDPVGVWMSPNPDLANESPASTRNLLSISKFWTNGDDSFGSDSDSIFSPSKHRRRQSCNIMDIDVPFTFEAEEEGKKEKMIESIKLKQRLQNIRIKQTTAELKRFQFFKNLVHARCERMLSISQYVAKFGRSIQSYNEACSDILTEQIPTLNRNEELSEKLHLKHQMTDKQIWDKRERLITDSLDEMMNDASQAEGELFDILSTDVVEDDDGFGVSEHTALSIEDTEKDMKLWDLPSELLSCSRYLRDSPPGVLIEGWLYSEEQTRSMLGIHQTWRRHWYILRNDGIYCLVQNDPHSARNSADEKGESIVKVKMCDVVLCTVREVPEDKSPTATGKPRFCFELVAANQKPIVLQARGPEELKRWIDGIRSTVEDILVKGNTNSTELNQGIGVKKRCNELQTTVMKRGLSIFKLNSKCDDGAKKDSGRNDDDDDSVSSTEEDDDSFAGDISDSEDMNNKKLIKRVMQANCTCADCGKDNPDWVSLNLGVLVCLECSGVHRSLGVHVSQVRSLTLDSLSDIEASVLLALGNGRMNKIYERNASPGRKPNSSSSRRMREEWIRSKYVRKRYIGLAPVKSREAAKARDEKISKLLHRAARKADVGSVAKFLVHGANVDWNNDGKYRRPLLVCAELIKKDNGNALVCAKLLVQNGASTDGLGQRARRLLETND